MDPSDKKQQSSSGPHDTWGTAIAYVAPIPGTVLWRDAMRLEVSAPTIVVLDDAGSRRELLCRTLRDVGYRAVPARSGIEAQWLHDHGLWTADLLLTSFAPAELDGYHPGFAVGALLDRIPILFMSELDRTESVRRGLIFPWAPYLRYPAAPSVLRRTVRQALSAPRPKPRH
jgi:DNA-binding response OmpR family regulator